MAAKRGADVDYSKSTNAFPMPPKEEAAYSVDTDVDYSKSTGAYPMYDDESAVPERVVEHVGSDRAEARFATPGPVSLGDPVAVAVQRADLGLDAEDDENGDDAEDGRVAKVVAAPPEPPVHRSPGARRK